MLKHAHCMEQWKLACGRVGALRGQEHIPVPQPVAHLLCAARQRRQRLRLQPRSA